MVEISPSYRELTYIAFAHRGARAYAKENTLDAFQLGLRLGATGLESDVWITKDGVPVLDHDGVVQGRFVKRPISQYLREDLPRHIPTLEDLFQLAPRGTSISLDIKDDASFDAVIATVRKAYGNQAPFIYLCHPNLDVLGEFRSRSLGICIIAIGMEVSLRSSNASICAVLPGIVSLCETYKTWRKSVSMEFLVIGPIASMN